MENRFKITQSTIESTTEQDQKRIIHNNSEKQRKEKIKSKIENIGHLLPRIRNNEKQSTLAILERAADYITEIQDKNDQLMCDNGVEVQTEEIHSLRQELDDIKSERDRLTDLIKTAGISSLLNASWKGRKVDSTSNSSDSRPESADTTSNVLQASSKKDKDTEGPAKSSKSKRHNTIHSQLENIANKKQIAKLAQETITKMNSGSILMPSLNNFNGMQTTNILPAGINQQQIFAATPNLLNTSLSNAILASNAQGQVIFSNANSAGSFVNLQGSSTQPSVAFVSPSSNLLANNSEKGNSDGSGLLQIAMRDAGITSVTQSFITPPQLPQITSQAQQAMISSIASTNAETMISADSSQGQQPTPQQTLASVPSNNQCINTGFMNSSFFSGNNCFQQGSNTITNTTQAINTQVPIMSIGQSNYNQILQNGNALINVPIMNATNQSLPVGGALPGIGGIQGLQTGQGQIVLVNDHSGLSLMPNYQMVVDPTTLTLTNNSRQFSNDKVATQKLGHAVDQTKMALTNVINNTEVINHAATLPVQNQQQAPQQGITLQNTISAQALASNPAPAMQQLAFQPAQQTISLGATNSVIQQAQMNNQLSAQQQQMLSAPYASANANFLNPNPGLVLPVSQNGNLLTLNTVPSQPNQLPTALILPNGHIIPVVTQPQVLLQQQLQQQQIQQQLLNANCQLQAAVAAQTQTIHPSQIPAKLAVVGNLGNNNIPIIDSNLTTILNPPNVQCQNQSALVQSQQKPPMGLLMTTTISNFPVSNAATTVASINNNMVTTSATQSVMTTQVQASQMHRPTSAPAFVKRSETQTSDSKGVVMSTTTGSLMQFRTSNTSTPDNSILLGNVSQTNLQTAVGTVPSQTDSSVTSSLPTNLQSSLPVNQSGQANGPNGTILITFGPPGGQQTCCILNSNSMQGLGNISNQQPSLPAISTIPTTISSTNPTVSSKKNNKKNSQRTIVPKPPKANQTNNPLPSVCSMNSSNSVSSTQVSVSSTLWNTTPLSSDQEASSTTMQNVVSTNDICVSTTAESTIIQSPSTSNTSENTGPTDILAKAAESIFSSSLQDISPPISSFYNPANEDNPLHIDTSAGETEDDCSAQSPSKESCDSDHIPTSSRIEMEAETQSTHSLDNACSNLTVSSPSTSTFFKESDICESIGAVSKRGQLKSKIIEPEKEKLKKDFKKLPDSKKLTKKPVSIAISEAINFASNQFPGVLEQVESVSMEKKKQKALNKELVKKTLKVPVKKQTPSVDIPDEIVFTESEISDVLDQVENLRNTWANENDQKKNKKRKGKSNCTDLDSDHLVMNKKKKPQIKESLIEVEEIKINSSVCESSMNAEENPSELLSPDSTTVTKTVSNYTPSSTDESPSGSNGENTCEKNVNYDPYDITLALEESEPIKSFRAIDSSKTFCQPNSSQVVASYPGKMIDKTQSSPTEIACSTSIHSHNQSNRLSSRLSPTSTGATSSNCISSNNGNSKNSRSRSNSIIDQQKSLQLACNSQPTSNEDNILPKNTYSNRQLTAGSQSVSVGSMSLPRSQQHSYNRQSQHIPQPSLSPVSMPSPISNISTAVEPETNSSVSQNVISNSSAQIASPCTSEQNNYSSPNSLRYSAESLFNTSTKLNTAQPKSHPQPLNQTLIPQDSSNIISNSISGDAVSVAGTLPSSKSRNLSIYSAENFVHSGRNDNSRVDKASYSSGSAFSSNNTHHIATSENDALNFANLGLTLTPTVPSNTFTDSSVCNSSTSFTFSLPNSNNTSLFPSHHFPFLHLHSLVTPQLLHGENNESSSNQQSQTFGLPSFGLNNQKNNNETESNIPHQNTSNEQNIICGSSSSSSTASSHLQSHNTFNFGLSNSLETCSISRSQPYTDGSNISLNTINLEKSSSNTITQSNDGARTVSNQKHLPNISQSISLSNRTQQSSLNSVDCSSQITSSVSTYFSPMNYQSLHTPPLHHPPVTSNENSRANISRSFNANLPTSISNFGSSTPVFNSRFDSNQLLFHSQRDTATVSQNVNINPEISKSTSSQQQNTVSKAAKQQASQQTLSLSQSQLSQGSLSSHQSTPSSISDNNATLTIPQSNPPPQPSHASQQQQQQQHQQQQQQQQQPQHQQQRSTKQTSRTKQSQSKKNKQSLSEVDSNLSQSIFDQNMALYFPINNTSPPPPRTIQGDTPTFLSSNLFTSSTRQIPNTSSTVLKSSDISTSFNSIFPPSRSQNGIGLNFQTGFGMNTVHNGPTNTPQIPPHSSAMPNLPHVPSLGLGNIFSDVNSTSQNEALNISPIKFPTNSILPPPQASIDPNSLQHHHQGGALYHNRSHPPPPPVIHNMSINSILSHNPHGFEPRGPVAQAINSTVTPSGFHGPSHSSFPIPPLNFSIHEH